MLFDTHCHLTDERLRDGVAELMRRAEEGGVARLVTVGYDRESSLEGAALAEKYDNVYCTVGIHPHDASSARR